MRNFWPGKFNNSELIDGQCNEFQTGSVPLGDPIRFLLANYFFKKAAGLMSIKENQIQVLIIIHF
jgi:hypothetical protein